ncbi:hypothetical protein AURDEDRAFT_132087, partial [Auricularia subglabra TFB-10046 SS5]
MGRSKARDDLSPYFNIPDELLDKIRPLLYHLALTSPAREDLAEIKRFVSEYLYPQWQDLKLDDPTQHPLRYGEQDTRKSVRELRGQAFLMHVRNSCRPGRTWRKKWALSEGYRADMEAMYATHPELEPVTDRPEQSPPEMDAPGDRSQSPAAHQQEEEDPTERGEEESTETLKEWKRTPTARELYADDIDDDLQLDVEQALDEEGLQGEDRKAARLGRRASLLTE